MAQTHPSQTQPAQAQTAQAQTAQAQPVQAQPSQTQPAQSLTHPEGRTPHPADTPDPAHHVPGSMDISAQERTFERFMRLVTRAAIVIVALLILLALVNG